MSPADGLTVRGLLVDGHTGAGLGGLRVELWRANGHGPSLMAASQSDPAGVVRFRLPPARLAGRVPQPIDVEWRVLDRGTLLLSEIRELPLSARREVVQLEIPPFAGGEIEHTEASPAVRYEVLGQVKGSTPANATVQAVLRTLHDGTIDEEVVGEGTVDTTGRYTLTFERPAQSGDASDASITLRLYAQGGDLIAESAPLLLREQRMRINLRPSRPAGSASEFELLEERIAEGLGDGAEGLDGAEEGVMHEVSEWLDVEPERLAMFQQARALGAETSVPAPAFYALGRSGAGLNLEDLLDVPLHELRTTLEEAAAIGIVESSALGDLDSVVQQLADQIVERAIRADAQPLCPGFGDVLATADLPPETISRLLHRYQARSGSASDFWASFTESGNQEVSPEEAEQIGVAIELSTVVGPDPPLLRHLHALRREGRWRSPQDLTDFDFDDWCDALEDVELQEPRFEQSGDDGDEGAEAEDEDEAEQRIESHAESILDALEDAYPNEFIRRRLAESEDVSAAARTVLARAPTHDFHRESIRDRIATNPDLVEGLTAEDAERATEEVEAVERVSKFADSAEEVAALVGTGMDSAMAIGSMPRSQFIDLYAEVLGGRAQASRVHAQAQQVAAASKMTTLRLLQSLQQGPFVLGAPAQAIRNIPDAKTLFQGAGGFCDCEHCGSVYSPAAYFVDLLRYLNVSSPERLEQLESRLTNPATAPEARRRLGRFQPLDVLLGRRPDLADLPLTCENTQTPLPYIDLVNELLEAHVTGGSAAFDTGKTPADVLRSVPQNLAREAYVRLQQAVHPLVLPYHQPLSLARAYLAHLGVTRADLMRALGRGDQARDWLIAESLGMSPEEFAMVVQPPAEPWRHFGFNGPDAGGTTFVEALTRVSTFLGATDITFQNLIDLVSTRFINNDNQVSLDTPSPDCDPDTIRIAGLDEARVSRMLRLIRLRRRLSWTFTDLDRALTAFGATDLDATVLDKLATARDLAAKLDRPLPELLALWAPIDTWGKNNQFDKLFTTRAVMWRADDERMFRLRPDRLDLADTSQPLDAVASALLAGFRITSEELALIRKMLERQSGTAPRLDLAGLSAIYRVVILARALQMRVAALDLLLRLTPPDANPLQPGDPAGTRRFVEIVREVQASDFTPERLAYLFRHETEPRRDPGPLPAQVEAVLASIRRGLSDVFSETTQPSEATGDVLRQKMAPLFDSSLLDSAIDVIDPRSALTPVRRQEFFDRHLAKLFTDPAAAAARLFGLPAPVRAPALAAAPAEPSPVAARLPTPAEPSTPAPAPAQPAEPAADPAALLGIEATPPPPDGKEAHWRANISFVLEQLLPVVRTRQLRGAVIQALSDTLGVPAPSTARLLEKVLHGRDRRTPMLGDFLAMLGTGLTGSYFANQDLRGEPAVTRVDPQLTFSWAGAAPAPQVPPARFSVRWTGHLLPRSNAPHTFYVQTDGAIRLTIKIEGAERVLIDQQGTAAASRPVEHASEPIALDPSRLYEIRIEYRNLGAPAVLSVQFGTGPAAKQPIPATSLYPADGLSSFAPVEQSYRRLHKAALILSGFGVTDAQLEWLTGDPPFLDFDALPMEAGTQADAVGLFSRWRALAGLYALRKSLPRSNTDLFDVFNASTMPDAITRLVLATGWERGVVDAFLGPQGMAVESPAALRPSIDAGRAPLLLRLARAVDVQRRVGVAPSTLYTWANTVPDADGAATIVQAVKARYDETRWLEVAQNLNDPLRAERRDALVAYLLPRMRELGVTNRNQLFEFFLLDVDMNPCMLTSRIRQATGAVQTFFQRCLMNLELKVPPRIIDDNDWKWLKNYRVWEANRKVFLYPENWIEPELRDDKSPLFQQLESTILQQEIKNDNVEAAFADYLEGLDEISRLDVRGVWFEERPTHRMVARTLPSALRIPPAPRSEWDHGTYHVFARTFNAPHVWYYRRLENGRTWTPWEKIDVDIDGDHLVPVVFNRRMHLFWAMFREVNKELPPLDRKNEGPPPALGKDWEIQLAYSVYDRQKWSRKRLSSGAVIDDQTFLTVPGDAKTAQYEGSRKLSPSDYTLRASVTGDDPARLQIHLYCRAVDRTRALGISLVPGEVQRVATFDLDGCNGALVPDRERAIRRAAVIDARTTKKTLFWRSTISTAVGNVRSGGGSSHAFRLTDGGILNAPAGYRVSAMGFAPTGHGGALLAFPPTDASGLAVALPRGRERRGVSVIPVINPKAPDQRGLAPFFYQDRFRSYFVRPIYANWREPRLVAAPLLVRPPVIRVRPAVASRRVTPTRRLPGRPVPPRFLRRGRSGRAQREGFDESLLTFDALDAWEELQDDAWHPDDAAEVKLPRLRKRKRPRTARPAPRPAPRPMPRPPAQRSIARKPIVRPIRRMVLQPQAGYHERRLQFTLFEHPDTCRLLERLKAKGIDGLLDFSTSRPPVGVDHEMRNGVWTPKPQSWFTRHYGVGPLLYEKSLPHLDVGFEADNPYGSYNWELFFHAPLQVAVRLAKDGRHEEAQRWFHFIFDPTTDSSAPSPRRYWRFAPFYENNEYEGARELMQLLSYGGDNGEIIERQNRVRQQLSAWWEKPFSPHVIARLRIAAYQKAVVMKYIDNLVEWGDKLFRRDSLESIQEATQIYILAANILGPRPEKIPPIVSKPPLTFQQMRSRLDLFSNFEVRLENLLVRRPFRINARPDTGAATAVLGMATQYFCTPPNPQLDKYWDTVADRLMKIRNCMNIQGVVRQLALFEPPIDPGLLVRAAAAGVDLGSVIASLNAPPPHYRFRVLFTRAVKLAEEIRSFGAMTLQVLEKRDAEGLASLRAANETVLLDAIRDIRKKQVRQVEEEIAEMNVQKEHVDLQIQHLNTQLRTLMNPQEEAQQKSLSVAQVISGVAEGIDLVSKVMHAIPEFQTGAAGGFSSPFVTLQLGGQMFGDIAGAFAASMEKVVAKNETSAELAEAQAEYQRRREEWQHELELLTKEKAQIEKRIAETKLKLEIASAELRRHDIEVDNSRKVLTYLRDKYTNQQLYGWMLGQLSGVYFQAYKVAFDAAQQAERAFRFERGDASSSFIEFSYWDSLKKGLFAGERLLVDLRRLESAAVEGDRRSLEVTRHVSLREDFPLAFLELIATGRCQIGLTEALLDGDFPGHYFRRVKTVSLSVSGVTGTHRNVNCTLTLLENRIRTNANASGSYAQSADGEDARFMINPTPVQAVATSKPDADPGLFHLRFDDDRYLPFEGSGAISTWRIELRQADNAANLADVSDVVMSMSYTARTGGAALEAVARADREKGIARGGIKPEAQHAFSLKRDLPAVWKRLDEAAPGKEIEVPLPLERGRFPGRYQGLDLRIERATIFLQPRNAITGDPLKARLDPPKGSGTAVTAWTPSWPQSPMLRATAEVSGPPGSWKLAVTPTTGKITDLLDDVILVFDVRARKV